jgi:hypothetical protein
MEKYSEKEKGFVMTSPALAASLVTSPPPAAPVSPTTESREKDFAIGLFDIGDVSTCMYAYCCPGMVVIISSSRSQLDGSEWCLNFLCLSPCAYRWMVRSAYGIGDVSSCGDDCMYSTCCSCCVANQLYQTTKAYGNPSPNDVGPQYNVNTFNNTFASGDGVFCNFIAAFCCTPCTMGKVMEKSIGMPFYLGCLYMNPFIGRNVMRYHYRLRPYTSSDNTEELMVPAAAVCLQQVFKFPLIDCFVRAGIAASVMQLSKEADIRGCARNRQYLGGYSPLQGNAPSPAVGVTGTGTVTLVPAMIVSNPVYPNIVYGSQPTGYGYGPVPTQSSHGRVMYAEDQTL